MTKNEYLIEITNCNIDEAKVTTMERKYHNELPDIVKKIISFSNETIIFDDEWRSLSFIEIYNAKEDLHVDFITEKIIPLIDCGENDFIIYNFKKNNWSKFNIIDDCFFKQKITLEELI